MLPSREVSQNSGTIPNENLGKNAIKNTLNRKINGFLREQVFGGDIGEEIITFSSSREIAHFGMVNSRMRTCSQRPSLWKRKLIIQGIDPSKSRQTIPPSSFRDLHLSIERQQEAIIKSERKRAENEDDINGLICIAEALAKRDPQEANQLFEQALHRINTRKIINGYCKGNPYLVSYRDFDNIIHVISLLLDLANAWVKTNKQKGEILFQEAYRSIDYCITRVANNKNLKKELDQDIHSTRQFSPIVCSLMQTNEELACRYIERFYKEDHKKVTALIRVAEKCGITDPQHTEAIFEQALNTIEIMQDASEDFLPDEEKAINFCALVKSRMQIKGAQETLDWIDGCISTRKPWMSLGMIQVQMQIDPEAVDEDDLLNHSSHPEVIGEYVEKLTKINDAKAFHFVSQNSERWPRWIQAIFFCKMAQAIAPTSGYRAAELIKEAQTIEQSLPFADASLFPFEVVKAQLEINPQAALSTALRIENLRDRNRALHEVFKSLIKKDLKETLPVVKAMKVSSCDFVKVHDLCEIGKELRNQDLHAAARVFQEALNAAKEVRGPMRIKPLLSVSDVYCDERVFP